MLGEVMAVTTLGPPQWPGTFGHDDWRGEVIGLQNAARVFDQFAREEAFGPIVVLVLIARNAPRPLGAAQFGPA
jgi:hypothetical protein